jgi:hypothetical protein
MGNKMKIVTLLGIGLAVLAAAPGVLAGGIPDAGKVIAFANDPAVSIAPSAGVVVDVKEAKVLEFLAKGHEVPCHKDWYYNDFEGDLSAPAGAGAGIASRIAGGDFICAQGGVIATADGRIYFWKLQEDGLITFSRQDGAKDGGFFRLQCDEAAATMPAALSFRTAVSHGGLVPPAAQDVVAFANRPAMPEFFKARCLMEEKTVLGILAHARQVAYSGKLGVVVYGNLPNDERRKVHIIDTSGTFSSKDLQAATPVETQGVIVTRQHQVYFWALTGPGQLLLVDEKHASCLLKAD